MPLRGFSLGLDSYGLRLVGYSIWFRRTRLVRETSVTAEQLSGSEAGQFPCLQEDAGEHGAVEAAGVRISQGGVIGGQ